MDSSTILVAYCDGGNAFSPVDDISLRGKGPSDVTESLQKLKKFALSKLIYAAYSSCVNKFGTKY